MIELYCNMNECEFHVYLHVIFNVLLGYESEGEKKKKV